MNPAVPVALVCALGLGAGGCRANESFGSEFSHLVAGAAIASGGTAIADHYGVENRAWVGFGASVGISFVSEAVQIAANGSSQVGASALDFGCNLVGAALGAWITDRFILAPVVFTDSHGQRAMKLSLHMQF